MRNGTLSRLIRQKVSSGLMLKKILFYSSLLCALYFLCSASISIYPWMRCTERARAEEVSWKIIELNPSQFVLEAAYRFTHQGKIYTGISKLPKPYLLNRPSAEKEIQRRAAQGTIIFFDRAKPSFSQLVSVFPLKKCFYALLTLGVLGYFFFLDRMYTRNA
jgi:hypothetical protein